MLRANDGWLNELGWSLGSWVRGRQEGACQIVESRGQVEQFRWQLNFPIPTLRNIHRKMIFKNSKILHELKKRPSGIPEEESWQGSGAAHFLKLLIGHGRSPLAQGREPQPWLCCAQGLDLNHVLNKSWNKMYHISNPERISESTIIYMLFIFTALRSEQDFLLNTW